LIGFPKVLNAMDTVNSVFKSRGFQLPLQSEGTVEETDRLSRAKEIQAPLYGDAIKRHPDTIIRA